MGGKKHEKCLHVWNCNGLNQYYINIVILYNLLRAALSEWGPHVAPGLQVAHSCYTQKDRQSNDTQKDGWTQTNTQRDRGENHPSFFKPFGMAETIPAAQYYMF